MKYFLFFLFFISFSVICQNLKVEYKLPIGESIPKKCSFKSFKVKNSKELESILKRKKNRLEEKGYFLASYSVQEISTTSLQVNWIFGPYFPNVIINIDDSIYRDLKNNGDQHLKQNSNFKTTTQFNSFIKKTLESFVNNGYPFAKVFFSEQKIIENQIYIQLNTSKGRFYVWKNIIVKGDSSIAKNTVQNLIGVRIGDVYNEKSLADVDRILQQTSFLQQLKKSEILFTDAGVELYVYLQNQKMSSLNGAIGLQPNPQTQIVGLIGEVQVKLINALKKAELIELNWRSIQPQTQALVVKFNYPFLFKTPFGLDIKFNIYKRDSTFLELKSCFGVQHTFKNTAQLKGFYQFYTSEILRTNNSSSTLSSFSYLSDLRIQSYGISFYNRRLNYLPNPSKGFSIYLESSIGQRTIDNDSVATKDTKVYKNVLQFSKFISLSKRNVLKFGLDFESYSTSVVFHNERFRFGGLNSLRGFNEEELFASTKLISTIEYRFLIDKTSNVFLFYDQGIYEDQTLSYKKDYPFGVGTGFSYGTKLGIFSISYAQGNQLKNPFEIKNGKIHFGYVTYF